MVEVKSISPFFIVRHVPSSLAFYRDKLGFEITFEGPTPDDIFFGIVRRGGAQILMKDIGVDPVPNAKVIELMICFVVDQCVANKFDPDCVLEEPLR